MNIAWDPSSIFVIYTMRIRQGGREHPGFDLCMKCRRILMNSVKRQRFGTLNTSLVNCILWWVKCRYLLIKIYIGQFYWCSVTKTIIYRPRFWSLLILNLGRGGGGSLSCQRILWQDLHFEYIVYHHIITSSYHWHKFMHLIFLIPF